MADSMVLGWLLLIVLWQKEGGMTMVAGGVILGLRGILKLARPELIVDHLASYALWMMGIGFVVWMFERYDVISQEFWERVAVAAQEGTGEIIKQIAVPKVTWKKILYGGIGQSRQIKNAISLQGKHFIRGFWLFLLRCRRVFLSIPLAVRVKVFIAVVFFFVLLAGTKIQMLDVVVLIFFMSGILFSWEPRISFVLAAMGLIVIPMFLIAGKNITAEVIAIHAYYFLMIGVLEEIVQMIRSSKGKYKGITVDKV